MVAWAGHVDVWSPFVACFPRSGRRHVTLDYQLLQSRNHSWPVYAFPGSSETGIYSQMSTVYLLTCLCTKRFWNDHSTTPEQQTVLKGYLISKSVIGSQSLRYFRFRIWPTRKNDLSQFLHHFILSCSVSEFQQFLYLISEEGLPY